MPQPVPQKRYKFQYAAEHGMSRHCLTASRAIAVPSTPQQMQLQVHAVPEATLLARVELVLH